MWYWLGILGQRSGTKARARHWHTRGMACWRYWRVILIKVHGRPSRSVLCIMWVCLLCHSKWLFKLCIKSDRRPSSCCTRPLLSCFFLLLQRPNVMCFYSVCDSHARARRAVSASSTRHYCCTMARWMFAEACDCVKACPTHTPTVFTYNIRAHLKYDEPKLFSQ